MRMANVADTLRRSKMIEDIVGKVQRRTLRELKEGVYVTCRKDVELEGVTATRGTTWIVDVPKLTADISLDFISDQVYTLIRANECVSPRLRHHSAWFGDETSIDGSVLNDSFIRGFLSEEELRGRESAVRIHIDEANVRKHKYYVYSIYERAELDSGNDIDIILAHIKKKGLLICIMAGDGTEQYVSADELKRLA